MNLTLDQWRRTARQFIYEDHRIACWLGENTKARPLVLVHGFPTASWDWAPVWNTLSQTRGLVAADMLGFGLSDKPRDGFDGQGYSIHRQADLHVALIEHLGLEEFDLLVHDYGVSVGQELLARQQNGEDPGGALAGLGKVIFLNGGIFPDQHRPRPIQTLGTSALGPLLSAGMNRKGFAKSFVQVFGPKTQPSEEELDDFWELIAHKNGHRIFHKLLHYIADRREHEERWVGALKNAQDRVGFINGALDPVSGRHAYDKWRATIPEARAHLLQSVGHYPQVEAPDAVSSKVLEWLG